MHCLWGQLVITSVKRPNTFFSWVYSKGEAHVFLTSMLLWRTSPPQYVQATALLIQSFVLCCSRSLLSTDSPHAWHCSSPYWHISSCFCKNDRSQLVREMENNSESLVVCPVHGGTDGQLLTCEEWLPASLPSLAARRASRKLVGGCLGSFKNFYIWSEHRPVNTTPRSLLQAFG